MTFAASWTPRSHHAVRLMLVVLFAAWTCCLPSRPAVAEQPWKRHAIDDSLRGADGVRLGDVNQDGLLDIVTGWEESGLVRVYLQPAATHEDPDATKKPWPAVTIGKAASVEDAVLVDLNNDGLLDVLASSEGKEQTLHCFFSPSIGKQLDASAWKTAPIEKSIKRTRWMFALPSRQKLGRIFLGSKHPRGQVSYIDLPPGGLDSSQSTSTLAIKQLAPAAWIMSLVERDVDGDGDLDLIYSDRKEKEQGVYWLECPQRNDAPWKRHLIGGLGEEVMFLSVVGSGDRVDSIFVAAKPNRIVLLTPNGSSPQARREVWRQSEEFAASLTEFSRAKAVTAGDVTGDGRVDLVYSCESADPPRQGVVVLTQGSNTDGSKWNPVGISGAEGIKFDLIELVDLDHDGDLDVLTCEERHAGRGLGVIWYENPLK